MKVNYKLLSVVFGGFLVVSLAYIVFFTNKSNTVIKEKEIQYVEVVNSKTELEMEHQSTLKKLGDAELRIDTLSGLNLSSSKEIMSLKKKVKSILYKSNLTKEELTTAKGLIVELNTKIEDRIKENEILKSNNVKLTEDNTNLQMEKNQLVKVLDSTKLEKENADNVIDLGSTLSISNLTVEGFNIKGKKTDVAEKVHKMKFSFVINENRISSNGVKTVYFILLNPIGKEVRLEGKSGILSTKKDGEKIYTSSSSLDYTTGLIKKANFDVELSKMFMDGIYKVQVYENGFMVGESKVFFKKKKLLGLF
jgi:regulator of replication initiation timing